MAGRGLNRENWKAHGKPSLAQCALLQWRVKTATTNDVRLTGKASSDACAPCDLLHAQAEDFRLLALKEHRVVGDTACIAPALHSRFRGGREFRVSGPHLRAH